MKRILNIESPHHLGKKIRVSGWVNSVRSHGKIIFVDLRDQTGLIQVVFSSDLKSAKELKPEWVISVVGKVSRRPKNMENPNVATGKIELLAEDLEILSKAKTLPFSINGSGYEISEELRLKYRYLDLRRERLKSNLKKRQEIIQFIRNYLIKKSFLEIETPILTKSTPEGARDFLVPSRLYPGKFYALPQSPQQYKQLLQVAGFEKYFQIARCFRDEDPRADRQPEFVQLDIEMSFIEQDDILNLTEELFIQLVKELFPEKRIAKIPFPRMPYREAIKKYQTDRPDLRKKTSKEERGGKTENKEMFFLWVVNFPMFEWKKDEKKWGAVHHPFTRPQTEDIRDIKRNPENILAFQYDLVLNGAEIGGGSLRTFKPEILEAVFEVMGHQKKEIKEKFGHLLKAFEYGVPPHGGIAMGLERFFSLVLDEPNIREVIAFPKTGDSRDLMMDSPSVVPDKQLRELHIKTFLKNKNK